MAIKRKDLEDAGPDALDSFEIAQATREANTLRRAKKEGARLCDPACPMRSSGCGLEDILTGAAQGGNSAVARQADNLERMTPAARQAQCRRAFGI